MTPEERRVALDAVAAEIRTCTKCRLATGRTRAVPGEGHPDTEVVLVGEGPGFNEDREGRPFVGRAGNLLVRMLATLGWRREEVFITNIVKCRPPDNRDPEPDEVAACLPYLQRQLAILDPALVVTLGRHSMARFMPGSRIGQAHGTMRPADPASGAGDALVYALYHPAAALRSTEVERQSFDDVAGIPAALVEARRLRAERVEATTPAAGLPVENATVAVPRREPGTPPGLQATPAGPASTLPATGLPAPIRPDDPGPSLDPMTLF